MKTSQIVIVVIAVVVIALIGLYILGSVFQNSSSTGTVASGVWKSGTSYPIELGGNFGVAAQSCVGASVYIYCVGGSDYNGDPYSNVYASTVGSTGMSSWSSTSSYPSNIMAQTCLSDSSYIYCIGGQHDFASDDVASSYFAPTTQSGSLVSWTNTTSYPIAIDSEACAVSSGYIYCVGGANQTDATAQATLASSSSWYAPINSSGIGSWTLTQSYPGGIDFSGCAASGTQIFCVGGENPNQNAVNSVYYASTSSSGLGAWTKTTNYPLQLTGPSCNIFQGYIYCVGGATRSNSYSNGVYYATVDSSGVGTWQKAANYPESVQTSCAIVSTYLVCVGGFDRSTNGVSPATYYADLSSIT